MSLLSLSRFSVFVVTFAIAIAGLEASNSPSTVVLVGDSTVASGSGWGDAFRELLGPQVKSVNLALGGRSSKSFRDEGHWEKALAENPDWVLIQFGHNDQLGKGPERETDAATTYRENLARYVAEARAIGAKPVLVTSIPRRNFNADGEIDAEALAPSWNESQQRSLPDLLNDYVVAARAVAEAEGVSLIDLNVRSIDYLNRIGPAQAAAFDPGSKQLTHPDKTHLSPLGAQATARLVVEEIEATIPELAKLIGEVDSMSLMSNWITNTKMPDGFPLATRRSLADVVVDDGDFAVAKIAAEDLVEDLEKVTGRKAKLNPRFDPKSGGQVVVGTLGASSAVDSLLAETELDVSELEGAWESFIIAVVGEGKESNLAIIGSDRRGTAYGVYELSQAIGVSPWNWWADVSAKKAENLFVSKKTRRFGPPSVKYRGIFINDEDWGLHPWAAHTFDPELGDIGPKTYEKVFQLMLRLKANTLWPAMHEVTKAFNLYPENKEIADRYAIVMASSHAEPMLRNNVTEWTAPKGNFNYDTNAEDVFDYWEQRVKENGEYENVYTLGMRGIHDSGMTAGNSVEDKVALLERIVDDQRELISRHVNPDPSQVPQVFTPYKEVLELYRAGMEVPEDVTIVWPDDNHGYIRTFPDDEERSRSGGSGVYYHISYLGSPLAYLWLYTTPPSLVWEEMSRAYHRGVQDYWILNVGDIKPGEIGTEFFLQMAWDIDHWNLDTQGKFLEAWARREFGEEQSGAIAEVMTAYFELNFQRRPEHLQWYMPYTRPRSSPLSAEEIVERLERFRELIESCDAIAEQLEPESQDAFFQLVAYPAKGSAYANLRFFHNEQYGKLFNADPAAARVHGGIARYADAQLTSLTDHYNGALAEGKWKGFMAVEPADAMWQSFRTEPLVLPAAGLTKTVDSIAEASHALHFSGRSEKATTAEVSVEAEAFTGSGGAAVRWQIVDDLGWSADAITVFPMDAKGVSIDDAEEQAPWVEYEVELAESGTYQLFLELLPTFPSEQVGALRMGVSFDGGDVKLVSVNRKSKTRDWSREVLEGRVGTSLEVEVEKPGRHFVRIYGIDTGVVLDQLFMHRGELEPSFGGPSVLR